MLYIFLKSGDLEAFQSQQSSSTNWNDFKFGGIHGGDNCVKIYMFFKRNAFNNLIDHHHNKLGMK